MVNLTDEEFERIGVDLAKYQELVDGGGQCVAVYPDMLRSLIRLFEEAKQRRAGDDGMHSMFAARMHPAQLEERARTWERAFEFLAKAKP